MLTQRVCFLPIDAPRGQVLAFLFCMPARPDPPRLRHQRVWVQAGHDGKVQQINMICSFRLDEDREL